MLITLNEKPKIQNYYNYMENCLETKQTKPRLEERKNWLLIAIYKLFAIFAAQVSKYKIEQGLNAYSTGVFLKKNQFPCKCFCTHLPLGDLPRLPTDDCGPQNSLIAVQSEELSGQFSTSIGIAGFCLGYHVI